MYNGYNLLVGTPQELAYYSNMQKKPQKLQAGLYGLSNHLLDTNWHKVERGKQALQEIIKQENFDPQELLDMMQDTTKAPPERLPQTGIPLDWENALSSIFIEMPARGYGTCCTTVLLVSHEGEVTFIEKNYAPQHQNSVQTYTFQTL